MSKLKLQSTSSQSGDLYDTKRRARNAIIGSAKRSNKMLNDARHFDKFAQRDQAYVDDVRGVWIAQLALLTLPLVAGDGMFVAFLRSLAMRPSFLPLKSVKMVGGGDGPSGVYSHHEGTTVRIVYLSRVFAKFSLTD